MGRPSGVWYDREPKNDHGESVDRRRGVVVVGHQGPAEKLLPDAVDQIAGAERVLAGDDPIGQSHSPQSRDPHDLPSRSRGLTAIFVGPGSSASSFDDRLAYRSSGPGQNRGVQPCQTRAGRRYSLRSPPMAGPPNFFGTWNNARVVRSNRAMDPTRRPDRRGFERRGRAGGRPVRALRRASCRVGDRDGFGELVTLTEPRVRRLLGRLVGRRADLDDLVQETYLRAWRALPRFRCGIRFST